MKTTQVESEGWWREVVVSYVKEGRGRNGSYERVRMLLRHDID